jgi:nitrate reductase NapD
VVISSLLVETVPSETERVIVELDKIDGVETHGTHNASVIVTIEASSINASYAIATSITAMDGVANVQLVYANFEDDPLIQKQLHG